MPDVIDYFSIQNLLHLYCECIDNGDFDQIGEIFAFADVYMPDEIEPSVKAGSREFSSLLKQWTRRYPEAGTPCTQHLTTGLIIEFDSPTQARTRSSFTVFQRTPLLQLQPIITGRYHDRFEKVDAKWRFVERREFIGLVGDLSAHLLRPLDGKDSQQLNESK